VDRDVDHGDHVIVMPSREGNGGGVVMLGRSDGVLCVHGGHLDWEGEIDRS
jgi:hypothetical protein